MTAIQIPARDKAAEKAAAQPTQCCSKCRYYTGHTSWCPNRGH